MEMLTLLTTCLFIGFLAGFMSGMFGIGGGSVRTPLLYFAGLPLLSAFGINLLVISGARIGSLLSLKTKPRCLEFGLSIFVIILALAIVYKALSR